jgi:septum site-determining protein MinC
MQPRDAKPVLEFEGHLMTFTIMRLLDSSVEVLARELDRRVQEAPARFRYLPVLLDVGAIAGSDLYLDLPGFAALLRTRGLVPVGIRGGDERWAGAAEAADLLFYDEDPRFTPPPEESTPQESSVATPATTAVTDRIIEAAAKSSTLVVTEPVRSGQQHYARGGDLVILAPVSFGAEVSADGHIHVYNTLQGRALAGVRGDTAARIFCLAFRADLVSIAGIYSVGEQFDDALRGKPVQVSLQDDALRIERL